MRMTDSANFNMSRKENNVSSTTRGDYRNKHQIQQLFSKIGYDLSPDVFNILFDESAKGRIECTIEEFQNELNVYLSAKDINKENSWLSARKI